MGIKPQDVVVVLRLALRPDDEEWSYASLAEDVGLSVSECHASVRRLVQAGLLHPVSRKPIRSALLEFLAHGLKYVFAAKRGGVTRGLPTAFAAAPLAGEFATSSPHDLPPVWPDPDGPVRGIELKPLYRSVPEIAKRDPRLYEGLALVDAIRSGRARERHAAQDRLRGMLNEN